jgi:hypothetical protein
MVIMIILVIWVIIVIVVVMVIDGYCDFFLNGIYDSFGFCSYYGYNCNYGGWA